MYNWSSFFESHTIKSALKGISKMQHFRFTADQPGYVFVKTSSDSPETQIKLLKDTSWKPDKNVLPEVITAPGQSLERQWYLYNKMREFCPDEVQDIVCSNLPHHCIVTRIIGLQFIHLSTLYYNCILSMCLLWNIFITLGIYIPGTICSPRCIFLDHCMMQLNNAH